jgi:hypothetical protein
MGAFGDEIDFDLADALGVRRQGECRKQGGSGKKGSDAVHGKRA